jgi:hypothetical protein
MLTQFRQMAKGTPFSVRAGLLAVAYGVFVFLGWFVADRFWKEGTRGIVVAIILGLIIIGCITFPPGRIVLARALVVFAIAIPPVFALVIIAQLTLFLLNLTHFNAGELFLKSIVGAAIGVGGGILYTLKGGFNETYWDKATGTGRGYAITELFQMEVLGGIFTLGIGAALFMTIPADLLTRIILSIFWGFYSAACAMVLTVLIDHEPAGEALPYILLTELVLLVFLVGNTLKSLDNEHVNVQKLYEGPEVAIPAAVTCIVVYLLVCLWSETGRRARVISPSLDVLLGQLDGLTGLAPVKAEVRQLIDMVRAEHMARTAGPPVSQVSRHLVFTGNPGTGKTTVARLLGQLYAEIGALGTGRLVKVTRSDLVADYLGQTASKTSEAVKRALGGILFIDEAYTLTSPTGAGQDFGHEAVDTLVKLMEDHREDLVVIAAGYGEEMAQFISSNPGLPPGFPRTIQFSDYSTDELLSIFQGMCESDQYQVSADALDGLRQYLARLPRPREFGNGRLVRDLYEAARACQASRVAAGGGSELATLTLQDLGLPDLPRPEHKADQTATGQYL